MNRIIFALAAAGICLGSCTSLTFQEKQELSALEYRGITVDRAPGGWQQPASPLAAGLLNVLPGGGNFYLASGNAADSSHWVYGMVNLLFWPISILWGVPEATIDAGNINKREMLNFYKYGNGGIPDFPGLEAAGPCRSRGWRRGRFRTVCRRQRRDRSRTAAAIIRHRAGIITITRHTDIKACPDMG